MTIAGSTCPLVRSPIYGVTHEKKDQTLAIVRLKKRCRATAATGKFLFRIPWLFAKKGF